MKTYSAKPGEVTRRWYVVDADGQILGRLASQIATILRGKHKPEFTPHVDVGDFVIVVNAERIALTGNKLQDKWYRSHSGYPGGLKSIWYERLLETHPERAIEKAVWGMIPKGRLGRRVIRKLKVYRGPDHPHQAQKPEPLEGAAPAGPNASQIRATAGHQESARPEPKPEAEAEPQVEARAEEPQEAPQEEAPEASVADEQQADEQPSGGDESDAADDEKEA